MKRKLYIGLGILLVLLIGVSVVMMTRTKDTKNKVVYKPLVPEEDEQVNRHIQDAIEKRKRSIQVPEDSTTLTAKKTLLMQFIWKQTQTGHQSCYRAYAETRETVEVGMSPHGFGPYPNIPDGYPSDNPFHDDMGYNFELMQRVRVKLFEDHGIFADGISMSRYTGLIEYVTQDVIWIEWATSNLPLLGDHKYAASIRGHPDTIARIRANVRNRESPLPIEMRQITEADIPSGVIVNSGSQAIDPYKYLNLQRQ